MNEPRRFLSAFTIPQFFHLTGLVIIAPFGLWMMARGQLFWGSLILLASLTSAVSFFLVSSPTLEVFGRLIAAIIPGGVVLAFLSHVPQFAMLWSFPLVVYFYFQLGLSIAVGLNVLFLGLAIGIVADGVSADILTRFIAAHLIIGIFSGAFAYDRRLKEDALRRLAHHDDLTGLPNRRRLMSQIEEWTKRASRYNESGVLLFIDVDDFKRINDRFGHDVGDQVLQEVAGLLSKRVRNTDLLGRLGGEEFLILLDKVSLPEARGIAEDLLQRFRTASFAHGKPLGLSIGAATYLREESVDSWIRHADQAMYQAKSDGGDRICQAPLVGGVAGAV